MQPPISLSALLHKIQQPGEASGVNHLAECSSVGSTVEEEEIGDHMEGAELVLLQ